MDSKSKVPSLFIGSGFSNAFFRSRLPLGTSVVFFSEGSQKIWLSPFEKKWVSPQGLGGGSNCWWACTPRFHPNDFKTSSLYRRGEDWLFGYDELEPYYCEAERIMSVAGDAPEQMFPRSAPFPLPPHRHSEPDNVMRAAYPGLFCTQSTARTSKAVKTRPQCCASGVCDSCPINAKFMIPQDMPGIFEDPAVSLRGGCQVLSLLMEAGKAVGVIYKEGEEIKEHRSDVIVLGANAFGNAEILLRSGIENKHLGRYLCEQKGIVYTFDLQGLKNFTGSTSITGHGYMRYDGAFRSEYAGCLMEFYNMPEIRLEPGRFQERLKVKCIFEEEPQFESRVVLDDGPGSYGIRIEFPGYSRYTLDGIAVMDKEIENILAPLPLERLVSREPEPTESHLIGTHRMGVSPEEGVVDKFGRLHGHPNVFVLGSGCFPNCVPANPTLTLAAHALMAADKLAEEVNA